MATISSEHRDVIAKLVPGGTNTLAQLSDDELLANTRRIVGRSNQLLALLLLHLAEVEARGIHRKRRCASIYTYCIYELRFSEDAAARRSAATRLVREFPPLFDAIAQGELHLTGLLMIGPHLRPENHVEVLGRAKFRTKKELNRLVRELNPLPRVPDCLAPLGPPPLRTLRNPTWELFVTAFSPRVRELPPGERPRDWANAVDGDFEGEGEAQSDPLPVGPVPKDLPPVTGPQHYQVQFTTVEEHAALVERAKALLARQRPGVTLGELHLEAMKLLVASLEKQKFAVDARPPRRGERQAPRQRGGAELAECDTGAALGQRGGPDLDERETAAAPRQRGETGSSEIAAAPRQRGETKAEPLRRTRHIPASERREVFLRDGGRCTYADERGERCCETHYLEVHHLQPFANGGANVAANLTLRCTAHNALAAEADFGAQLVAERRSSMRHEAFAIQPGKNM
jgi:5-methylcytosine-specific restriction endonuclease McrA